MPVTIKVAKHDASPVLERPIPAGARQSNKSSQDVLERLCHKDAWKIGPILETNSGAQTSLPDSLLANMRFEVKDHGLVRAACDAYNRHHHLVIRPEDIWFAVLTQFSFYVNAHADELRFSFVAHKGRRDLILKDEGQPDMGLMCRNMTKLIDENIVDPKLREWILPSFTTTTINDEVVASVIMMGSLQKYFEYVYDPTICGIPTITLLGEASDWEDMQCRIEKLNEYDTETSQFCDLLRPVLKYMVASFTEGPSDPGIVDFWSRMVDRNADSGTRDMSGWLTAFCFWDENGQTLAGNLFRDQEPDRYDPHRVELFGQPYHSLNFADIPAGFLSVPVTYVTPAMHKIDTELVAGFVGYEELTYATLCLNISGTTSEQPAADQVDTLKPLIGWWMHEAKGQTGPGTPRDELHSRSVHPWDGSAPIV